MAKLNIRPKGECAWDLVSLGEVMLRLDPGDGVARFNRASIPGMGGWRRIQRCPWA